MMASIEHKELPTGSGNWMYQKQVGGEERDVEVPPCDVDRSICNPISDKH